LQILGLPFPVGKVTAGCPEADSHHEGNLSWSLAIIEIIKGSLPGRSAVFISFNLVLSGLLP